MTPCGKSSIPIFQEILTSIEKKLFWQEDWVLDYNSGKFWDFADFS